MTRISKSGAVAQHDALVWLKSRPWRSAVLAGAGGFIAIALLAFARDVSGMHLLIPPFGASCVLAFGFPASPFAQPKNIVGGHVISALMGLLACALLGYDVLGIATGVGLAITAMMVTDTVHPPAGANPIVVALTQPAASFLIMPVLVGAVSIVLLGRLYVAFRARTERE